jgi:hypothetical protein
MLPPGWARLLTSFIPTGSGTTTKTIGIVFVAACAASAPSGHSHQQIDVKCNELCGISLIELIAFSRIPILKREPRLWPTQLLELLAERNKEYGFLLFTTSVPKNADFSSFTCCV